MKNKSGQTQNKPGVPAAQAEKSNPSHPGAIAFNIELSGLLMFEPAADTLGEMVLAIIERAFAENKVSTDCQANIETDFHPYSAAKLLAACNYFYGFFVVSDFERGLQVVEAELRRIGLLAESEIGWQCPHELNWRRYYPKDDPRPFEPNICRLKTDGSTTLTANPKMIETVAGIKTAMLTGKFPQ